MMSESIVVILGATGTGKSDLGMALARELGGEIVNGDALQVYRGLDIGTAKPTVEDRREVRHHLVDILDPREPFSAGEFARRARGAIEEIRGRGALPIVVGGTGLYLRALLEGISDIPAPDPRVREWLRTRRLRAGLPPLRRMLRLLDPSAHGRITAGDHQRILRALEVGLSSGRALSSWQAAREVGAPPGPAVRIGLTLPRPILYHRIAGRAFRMLAAGWVQEVENLMVAGLDSSAPAFQAIGYRQLAQHLQGRLSLEQAVEETLRATRRFAKRQSTWFRSEPGVVWFQAQDPAVLMPQVLHHIRTSGVGRGHGETSNQHPGRVPVPEPQGGS
jgi:tRNA dimethylallyltransferase